MNKFNTVILLSILASCDAFFLSQLKATTRISRAVSAAKDIPKDKEIKIQKLKLLDLLGAKKEYVDPVLADPITKESLKISSSGVVLGGERSGSRTVQYELVPSSGGSIYRGTSDTFLNLLEPDVGMDDDDSNGSSASNTLFSSVARSLLVPMIPPQLRSPLSRAGFPLGDDYVPMRDLFTSPTVSFAYERGWRQNFATAGFPGPDKEAKMASEYFAPVIAEVDNSVLVDMSCASGLFTRRFAKSGKYDRVLGCDFSPSMLLEARQRINADADLSKLTSTKLDLVRCDVGKIPMRSNSVDVLHAGAAMHCWPDLPLAVSEIHRVLKPGGRYFATTFLSTWFRTLQSADGGGMDVSKQAFQYFASVDVLRDLLIDNGFSPENVSIEVIQPACVVIRCEK